MRVAIVPRIKYHIGQELTVLGVPVRVESYSHTGINIIVTTREGAAKFERIVCIVTDDDQIITAKETA